MQRPDLLVILTDQQSASMLGCAGNAYVRTPACDALAARGTRFERAYCTAPLCMPSRFSLWTGRMPSAIGLRTNRFAGVAPAAMRGAGLGHLLRAVGYRCLYAGKQHLPGMSVEDLGFDLLTRDERDGCAEACAQALRAPRDRPLALVVSLINPHDICYMAIRDAHRDGMRLHVPVDPSSDELRELDLALARPPGVSAERFFAELCPPAPPNLEPQVGEPAAIGTALAGVPFRRRARERWSVERWREHHWAYCRLTERVDGQIGRVLAALAESGHAGRTLVVMTSDHGDLDGAHRLEHKDAFYEEAARVPFILAGPSITAGRVDRRTLVSNGLDLVPTLCAAAGATRPADLVGVDLLAATDDGAGQPRRAAVPVESCIGSAVIGERWKYARYDACGSEEELVDLVEDPGEMRNRAGDPACADALARCRRLHDAVVKPSAAQRA